MEQSLFIFSRCGRTFALPQKNIEKIVEAKSVHRLWFVNGLLQGLVAVSGTVVAYFDFGLSETPGRYTVIVRLKQKRWAFSIDRMLEFLTIRDISEKDTALGTVELPKYGSTLLVDEQRLYETLLFEGGYADEA